MRTFPRWRCWQPLAVRRGRPPVPLSVRSSAFPSRPAARPGRPRSRTSWVPASSSWTAARPPATCLRPAARPPLMRPLPRRRTVRARELGRVTRPHPPRRAAAPGQEAGSALVLRPGPVRGSGVTSIQRPAAPGREAGSVRAQAAAQRPRPAEVRRPPELVPRGAVRPPEAARLWVASVVRLRRDRERVGYLYRRRDRLCSEPVGDGRVNRRGVTRWFSFRRGIKQVG